jgi:hypothetical protein
MKKFASMFVTALLLSEISFSQPTANPDPSHGNVVLADNSIINGSVQDNIRKKGEVVVTNNGKKTKYKAADINGAQIGNIKYITYSYTFYEVVLEGKNITLLRKANEPSGVQYNGSEAIVVSSEGNIDDLFIRKAGGSLKLLTKANIKEVLGVCAASFDTKNFDLENVKKAVEACDK